MSSQRILPNGVASQLVTPVDNRGEVIGNGVGLYYPINFERARNTFINTTAYHDFCEFLTSAAGQEKFTPVTTSDSLELVSTSANDTSNGTGTRTVGIIYLNALGDWSEITITLNGLTPVPVPIVASAINAMYAKTGGNLSVSAGDIFLRNSATPTTIYEQIASNGNMSQSGRFTVPNGYRLLVHNISVSAQGQAIEIKVRANNSPFDGSTLDRFLFKKSVKLAAGDSENLFFHNFSLNAGQTIKVSGIVDATSGTPRVFGTISTELIKL